MCFDQVVAEQLLNMYTQLTLTGIKTGFGQKVWKRLMQSSVVYAHICWMNPKWNILFQGGLGVLPQKFFGLWDHKWCIPVSFSVTIPHYPYPLPFKFLFRFTLISGVVMGVGEKSEIRLKSEIFDHWLNLYGENTNPARGILDFCKQKFYRPLLCSPWTLYSMYTLCYEVRTLHNTLLKDVLRHT